MITDSNLLEDAYAEHGEREMKRAGKADLGRTDLAQRSATGLAFIAAGWDLGNDLDGERDHLAGEQEDQSDRTARKSMPSGVYRDNPAIANDLVNEGHGFKVWRLGTNPDLPTLCRYCGRRLLTDDERWPCEYAECGMAGETGHVCGDDCPRGWEHQPDGGPLTPGRPLPLHSWGIPVWTKVGHAQYRRRKPKSPRPAGFPAPFRAECECNGCAARRAGRRRQGQQPRVCGDVDCQRLRKKANTASTRRRADERHRQAAAALLWDQPELSDREVAERLDVPRVRAREGRALIAGGWLPLGSTAWPGTGMVPLPGADSRNE